MGLSAKTLPDNILRCMTRWERRRFGSGGLTSAEAQKLYIRRYERHEQGTYKSFLEVTGLGYYCPRPDKKSTVAPGLPDFCVLYEGFCLLLEFKRPDGGRLSEDQDRVFKALAAIGCAPRIVYSADRAIEITRAWRRAIDQTLNACPAFDGWKHLNPHWARSACGA